MSEAATSIRRPRQMRGSSAAERARREREVSLLDMIDRLLAGGVVIHGDITLAVADVDLVYLGLRAVIASTDTVGRDLTSPLDRPGPLDKAGPLDRPGPLDRREARDRRR